MLLPKAVEDLSFSEILERKKAKLKEIIPSIASQLVDSDPAIALLEESAYTEGLLRNKLNQNVLAITVQFASETDLDNLGKFYGIQRKLIQEEDNSSIPPIPAIYETDEDLRARIMEAPKSFSVAGPRSSYVHFGKLADNKVKDISAISEKPGVVNIAVLSYEGDGKADNNLIQKVSDYLNNEEIRPIGDKIEVKSAEIINFEINLLIEIENNPNSSIALETVKKNLQAYVKSRHKLTGVMAISGIYASCHEVLGVKRVVLESPKEDIATQDNQAPYCTNINVNLYE